MPNEYGGPLPVPTPESAPFWRAAKQHRLSIPYCNACAKWFFYPRPFCPTCLSEDVVWRDASGKARLVSFVIQQRAPRRVPIEDPYVIGMVELAEGPRLLSHIVDVEPDPARVSCDIPLEAVFADLSDEISLVKFRPVIQP